MKAFRCFSISLIFFIIVGGASSCSIYRGRIPDQVINMPEEFRAAKEFKGKDAALPDRWWKCLGYPELNALMEKALGKNLDIEQAFFRCMQYEAMAQKEKSFLFPSLNASGEAGREKTPSFFGDSKGNSYKFSLAASYEVDIWGKYRSSANAARFLNDASFMELSSIYITISSNLVELYFLSQEYKQNLMLQGNLISSLEEFFKGTEDRYNEGLVDSDAVYMASKALEEARSQRPLFEQNLSSTLNAISVICGEFPSKDHQVDGDLPERLPDFSAGLPSELLARRPDIQASFFRLKARDAEVGEAVADLFPSFDFFGAMGRSRSNFGSAVVTGSFWELLLDASMPVFDAGRRKAEVRRAEEAFNEELSKYRATVLNAFKEVEDALLNFNKAREKEEELKKHLASASSAFDLSKARYLEGLDDYLQLLSSEQAVVEAEKMLVTARMEKISAWISIMRVLGGTWPTIETVARIKQRAGEETLN